MFSFIKEAFGKDGIKMFLHLAPAYPKQIATINGQVEFVSQKDKWVNQLEVNLLEEYSRGRGRERRQETLILGTWSIQDLSLKAGGDTYLSFAIEFDLLRSPMQVLAEEGNPLIRPLARLAQSLKGVESRFYVQARASVADTRLDLLERREIILYDQNTST